jgi:hypothetical protein
MIDGGNFTWTARWFDPYDLPEGVVLYPQGLEAQLMPPTA